MMVIFQLKKDEEKDKMKVYVPSSSGGCMAHRRR